jgi:hypothetical protein
MSMLGRLGRVKVSGRSGKVNLDRSVALGLNDQGEICGSSISASENDPVSVATLWIGEDVVDVNALIGKSARDVVLVSADGINRDRDLVCTGYLIDEPDLPRLFRVSPR